MTHTHTLALDQEESLPLSFLCISFKTLFTWTKWDQPTCLGLDQRPSLLQRTCVLKVSLCSHRWVCNSWNDRVTSYAHGVLLWGHPHDSTSSFSHNTKLAGGEDRTCETGTAWDMGEASVDSKSLSGVGIGCWLYREEKGTEEGSSGTDVPPGLESPCCPQNLFFIKEAFPGNHWVFEGWLTKC